MDESGRNGRSEARARIKVAIVGTGMAGLVAAHRLTSIRSRNNNGGGGDVEVHLFERGSRLGLDANSISIAQADDGADLRVDVPMRSFNAGEYGKLPMPPSLLLVD